MPPNENTATFGLSDWHAHPSVWILLGAIVLGYALAITRLRPAGAEVKGRQVVSFYAGMLFLWIGADFPIHDLAERYLFSAHMVQHTLFSLVAPPLLLMGMPAWMLRKILEPRWVWNVARVATRPFIALVSFNVVIAVTHWPTLVNASVTSEPLHFGLHLVLFTTATMMWWPVISPLPELARLSEPAKMLYLFLQSIVPTVPASFLTFSSSPIFSFYAHAPRLWGLDAVNDQRIAGLFMKIGGGLLLWLAIAILFFRWSAKEESGTVDEVTWDDFERELQAFDMRGT